MTASISFRPEDAPSGSIPSCSSSFSASSRHPATRKSKQIIRTLFLGGVLAVALDAEADPLVSSSNSLDSSEPYAHFLRARRKPSLEIPPRARRFQDTPDRLRSHRAPSSSVMLLLLQLGFMWSLGLEYMVARLPQPGGCYLLEPQGQLFTLGSWVLLEGCDDLKEGGEERNGGGRGRRRVHEGLGDDGERGVHHFRHVDVEGEVGVLEDVHPEPQRKAASNQEARRGSCTPGSGSFPFGREQSVASLLRRFPLEANTKPMLLEAQAELLGPMEGNMDSLLIHIVVFQRLLIQEVKEIFDSRWHHCPRAQHTAEEVIYELLQRSLKDARQRHIAARDIVDLGPLGVRQVPVDLLYDLVFHLRDGVTAIPSARLRLRGERDEARRDFKPTGNGVRLVTVGTNNEVPTGRPLNASEQYSSFPCKATVSREAKYTLALALKS
ncbi:hypothetical protein EYF80_013773 [Liparis tanakae]|uniref:Uncharacterized protein n=1 Tax=Liparis tanakae TaxID=230148 RepID=A0A4Z2IDG4_9TELE|nr:hypothetical protein EYF80_013773 [Liparis tanakae]